MISLALLLNSCATNKINKVNTNLELIEPDFPDPYIEDQLVITLSGETVSMPLWYLQSIMDFKNDVHTEFEIYREWKNKQ